MFIAKYCYPFFFEFAFQNLWNINEDFVDKKQLILCSILSLSDMKRKSFLFCCLTSDSGTACYNLFSSFTQFLWFALIISQQTFNNDLYRIFALAINKKPRSYASSKLSSNHLLTGVGCRATSVENGKEEDFLKRVSKSIFFRGRTNDTNTQIWPRVNLKYCFSLLVLVYCLVKF